MKKVFSVNNSSNAINVGLLTARIGISVMMFTHGIPKLIKLFSGAPVQFPEVMGMSAELSLSLAIFAELLCSVFILIGCATRLAVIPLITTMVVVIFFIHAADPFPVKESASLYLLGYVVLLFAGSGKYSMDSLLHAKMAKPGRVDIKQQPEFSISR